MFWMDACWLNFWKISFEDLLQCQDMLDLHVFHYQVDFTKYKTLVIQMFVKQMSNESKKAKLELLCGIEVFLGFDCIIRMLPYVQSLSKFVQTQNIFICDFVVIIKSCEGDLY